VVRAFRSEKQDHWLEALEEAFRHWGRSGTAGCPAIWGSITAAGATWLSVASALSVTCSCCSLNDLVRKHI
jgi:hypothetical protein